MELHKMVGVDIINVSGVSLLMSKHEIPDETKGIIVGYNNIVQEITLRWYVGEKRIEHQVGIPLFKRLLDKKVIDLASNHIKTPAPLYDIGNLVEDKDGGLKGIITFREYAYDSNEWWYTILVVSKTVTGGYSTERECEEYIKQVDEINTNVSFKGNDYELILKKIQKSV